MPFSRKKTELMNARCNVRLTASELADLQSTAAQCGLSLSEYMRRRSLGVRIVAHSDLSVVRELRRFGGLLKSLHIESKGAYSATTGQMLGQIGAWMTAILNEPER